MEVPGLIYWWTEVVWSNILGMSGLIYRWTGVAWSNIQVDWGCQV